jgi:hypothetical protein
MLGSVKGSESTPKLVAELRRPRRVMGFACLLVLAGTISSASIRSATREFAVIGLSNGLIFGSFPGLLAVAAAFIVFIVTSWVLELTRWPGRVKEAALFAPSVAFFLAVVLWAVASARPPARFRQLVIDPMPPGVLVEHAAGFNAFLASRWVLQFRGDTNALAQIVQRQGLNPYEPFDFRAMLQRDAYLQQLPWLTQIPGSPSLRIFKRRTPQGAAVDAVYLVHDPATARAWFYRMRQN